MECFSIADSKKQLRERKMTKRGKEQDVDHEDDDKTLEHDVDHHDKDTSHKEHHDDHAHSWKYYGVYGKVSIGMAFVYGGHYP